MEDIAEEWMRHLRLSVLRSLLDLPQNIGHESMLVDLVNAIGIGADRDQVRGVVKWLSDQGLVTCEVKRGALVASLTDRGESVAEGKANYPGVKRPSRALGVAAAIALDRLKE
jgi:hypothetical protein